jgi:hypothetical protein
MHPVIQTYRLGKMSRGQACAFFQRQAQAGKITPRSAAAYKANLDYNRDSIEGTVVEHCDGWVDIRVTRSTCRDIKIDSVVGYDLHGENMDHPLHFLALLGRRVRVKVRERTNEREIVGKATFYY